MIRGAGGPSQIGNATRNFLHNKANYCAADHFKQRNCTIAQLVSANVVTAAELRLAALNSALAVALKIHERYTHLDVDTKRRALEHLRPLDA